MEPNEVLNFWLELDPKKQFGKDAKFDKEVEKKFKEVFYQVVSGETAHWRNTPEGRLAEIIVLDQFSRNMFRDKPEAFRYDFLALALAQEAIRSGDDKKLNENERRWVYMPFMHSESKKIHEEAVQLFAQLGNEEVLEYEKKHKNIVDMFGRYPHRNSILGRESTKEEKAFLQENPGF